MRNTMFFYPKLAASNMKKNKRTYGPYLLATILCAAIYYILRSLALNPGLREEYGGAAIHSLLQMGGDVSFFFIILFLFYINNFLMKQRNKEFALYNVLGMGKKHIAKTVAYETLYTYCLTVVGGLGVGILLDKLTYLAAAKLMHMEIKMGFFLAPAAVNHVLLLFAVAFLLIYLRFVWKLHIMNPAEMLRESKAGEREPKAKWFLAILGFVALGVGYTIALRAKNPIEAIPGFMVAALFVIIATFLIFTAGSVALLKLLKKNKHFYYKTNHFVSLSGLMYRMKQNAMGLASICIMSTMVLVMISTTGSLMLGVDQMMKERYPYDFNCESGELEPERQQALIADLHALQQEEGLAVTEEVSYRYVDFAVAMNGKKFEVPNSNMSPCVLMFVPIDDYNAATGAQKTLNDGEFLVHTKRMPWTESTLSLYGEEYAIKEHVTEYPRNGWAAANISDYLYLVCSEHDFETIYATQKEAYGDIASDMSYYYGFNTSAGKQAQDEFRPVIRSLFEQYDFTCESRLAEEASYTGLFSGMFFIGISLGLLFTIATVLMIYYKQLSEGYEDQERFQILQKVGMSQKEVKKSIHSQILTVFFMPPMVAGLHLAVAFPILKRLVEMLGFPKSNLFLIVTLVCFCVFVLFYVCVYLYTARTYYKIVKR